MTYDYCTLPATQHIPAVHGDACLTHTIEFWRGFLAYAKTTRSLAIAEPLPVLPPTH